MSFLHSRSILNKRSVQVLVILVLFVLFFIGLPPRLLGDSLLDKESESTYSDKDVIQADNHYEATLVVASRTADNTTWLLDNFKAWKKLIYVVDDAQASLTVPLNKGREAMVYLTYIINHYDSLQNVSIFVHAERYQWHNDDPDYDGQRNLERLNTSHIQAEGYANLRCAWILGCPAEIRPYDDLGHVSVPPKAGEVYKESFEELFPGVEVPKVVGSACCAQIAVSREAIRSRPKEDYVRYRQWIIETDIEDDLSGRVLEYSWHIIFGNEAVFCPTAQDCYCSLYGLCDLDCKDERSCTDRYVLPPYSSLPHGWPTVGWQGEARKPHDH